MNSRFDANGDGLLSISDDEQGEQRTTDEAEPRQKAAGHDRFVVDDVEDKHVDVDAEGEQKDEITDGDRVEKSADAMGENGSITSEEKTRQNREEKRDDGDEHVPPGKLQRAEVEMLPAEKPDPEGKGAESEGRGEKCHRHGQIDVSGQQRRVDVRRGAT